MDNTLGYFVIVVAIIIIGMLLLLATPADVILRNTWNHTVQTADDLTDYDTLKKVEDTCRAMIASYNSDLLTYNQYKDSEDDEKQGWSEQAKMRANKTASSYNNYVLKNKYVWKAAVPDDISMSLEYVE